MARLFNGTSQGLQIALNLSAYSVITVSFWLWWNVFNTSDNLVMEYGTTWDANGANGFIADFNYSGGVHTPQFGIATVIGGVQKYWNDEFPRPSAAAWHHYMMTLNRATPAIAAWVDGAPQTLTLVKHDAVAYGNFGNQNLNLMCRNAASLFAAGRLAEYAMWGGVALGTGAAKSLSIGALPITVHPDNLIFYPPIFGADSPEPDYSGGRHSATLVGAPTFTPHPGITQGLLPKRAFQPMPV